MRLLLDSHVLLWWSGVEADRLSGHRRAQLEKAAEIFVSAATVWELEIKRQAGKLDASELDWSRLDQDSIRILAIDRDDALAAAALPLLHRDPFDRMIIAQARRRGLTLVSADAAFAAYDVALLRP